jgi:hypothetical protein
VQVRTTTGYAAALESEAWEGPSLLAFARARRSSYRANEPEDRRRAGQSDKKGDRVLPAGRGDDRRHGIHFGIIVTSSEPPHGTSMVRLGANQVGSPPLGLGFPRLTNRLPQRTVNRCSTGPYLKSCTYTEAYSTDEWTVKKPKPLGGTGAGLDRLTGDATTAFSARGALVADVSWTEAVGAALGRALSGIDSACGALGARFSTAAGCGAARGEVAGPRFGAATVSANVAGYEGGEDGDGTTRPCAADDVTECGAASETASRRETMRTVVTRARRSTAPAASARDAR